jgi:hypothetical protein
MAVSKVDVPNDRRIVEFGARSIYVVRKDAEDLQYLQRKPLQRSADGCTPNVRDKRWCSTIDAVAKVVTSA